jgi:pyruvate kinase
MLQSMIEQASPTRAEVSDVANAIFDGTDAVMLSGETSVGKFPIAAVHIMAHIAETTEDYIVRQPKMSLADLKPTGLTLKMSAAAAHGVWQIVQDLDVKLVAIWSQTGATARIFSKTRFPVPIIALSSDHRALRRMSLHYGVVPQELPPPSDMRELVRTLDELVQKRHFAAQGDRIVVVAGAAFGIPGTMNGIIIHTIGDIPEESAATPLVEALYR